MSSQLQDDQLGLDNENQMLFRDWGRFITNSRELKCTTTSGKYMESMARYASYLKVEGLKPSVLLAGIIA